MTGMQISEEDALHILDVSSFSDRKINVVDEQTLPEEFCARVAVVLSATLATNRH